jgi:hypothetical protein
LAGRWKNRYETKYMYDLNESYFNNQFYSNMMPKHICETKETFTTSGTYPWSFVTQIFHNGQSSHGGGRKTLEMMTST